MNNRLSASVLKLGHLKKITLTIYFLSLIFIIAECLGIFYFKKINILYIVLLNFQVLFIFLFYLYNTFFIKKIKTVLIQKNMLIDEINLFKSASFNAKEQKNYIDIEEIINYIPFITIITNNEGTIINYNTKAKEIIFNISRGSSFTDLLYDIYTTEIKEYAFISVKVKHKNLINGLNDFYILQSTFYYINDKNTQYVLLILFPNYNTLDIKDKNITEESVSLLSNDEKLANYDLFFSQETIELSKIIENLAVGIIIINEKKDIILINQKALNYMEIKKSNFKIEEVLKKYIKDNEISNFFNEDSGILKIKNNKYQSFDLKFSSYNNNKIITLINITEQADLEKKITFSQKLQTIGQIASAVAHDFNNLLTAIMSFAYFLKERYTDEDPSTIELDQIQQNANRAKVMIRQLLTFSRSQELSPISFDVNSEISNLMSTILRLMGEKIKSEFKRGQSIGNIMMDPVQFQQILINLIVNARDAMKQGGNLVISTDKVNLKNPIEGVIATIPSGNYVLVTIEDQGEGIKKENLRKIFQMHFSTKGDRGNGLGLATVAKILKENSGFINVTSTPNKGTTFYLYLQPDNINNIENNASTLIKNDEILDLTGTGTIMLVEDEIPVRMVCKRILTSKGYKVIEAEDANSALKLLQKDENKVDLIISDVMMPGINGPEFIAKAREKYPNIRAILMSGYAEDVLEDKDYVLDHVDFLSKPFSPDVLATKVKKTMNKIVS